VIRIDAYGFLELPDGFVVVPLARQGRAEIIPRCASSGRRGSWLSTANVPSTSPSFEKNGVDQTLAMRDMRAASRHGVKSGLVSTSVTITCMREVTAAPHEVLVGVTASDAMV